MVLGILSICFGLLFIYLTVKYPEADKTNVASDLRGYLGGTAFIIIGIIRLINCFT